MVYKYRATAYKIPAQVAGEYLETIDREEGGLTAQKLLDKSRPEDALLHDTFEWDDTEAAEKYRLGQARFFIGNVITVEVKGEQVAPTRAFVSVSDAAHSEVGVFRPIIKALTNEDHRKVVLKNAMRDMQSFKEKYENLSELANVISAMNEVLEGA